MESHTEHWLSKYWGQKDRTPEDIATITQSALAGTQALLDALAKIGITIKKGKLHEFERMRMPELIKAIQATTQSSIDQVTEPRHEYAREHSEHLCVRNAVDEAIKL